MTALHYILQVSLINVLFYLTLDIRVNVDVISQHINIFGPRLCGDRKAEGIRLGGGCFFIFFIFLWDLNESNRALTQATSVPGTLWISNYIAPNKPASRLPPKNSYPLPSPNNMQPVCQKLFWNCVFQISNDQIALLSGRPEDIVLRRLSK